MVPIKRYGETMNWKEHINRLSIGDKVKVANGTTYYYNKNLQSNSRYLRSSIRIIKDIEDKWAQLDGDSSCWFLLKDMVKQ